MHSAQWHRMRWIEEYSYWITDDRMMLCTLRSNQCTQCMKWVFVANFAFVVLGPFDFYWISDAFATATVYSKLRLGRIRALRVCCRVNRIHSYVSTYNSNKNRWAKYDDVDGCHAIIWTLIDCHISIHLEYTLYIYCDDIDTYMFYKNDVWLLKSNAFVWHGMVWYGYHCTAQTKYPKYYFASTNTKFNQLWKINWKPKHFGRRIAIANANVRYHIQRWLI